MSSEQAPGPTNALHSVLAQTGRSLTRATLWEAGATLLLGVILTLLAGFGLSALRAQPLTILAIEGLLLLLTGAALVFWYRRRWRALFQPTELARWLDRILEQRGRLGGSQVHLLSALELARDQDRYGESAELGNAAIAQAAELAQRLDPASLVRSEHQRSLRQRLIPLFVGLLVLAGLGALWPLHLRGALLAVTSLGRLEQALERLPPEPRLGDFRIAYQPPAYSERPPIVQNSPNGVIRALPGTEVTIETRARDEVIEGTLLVSYGEDTESPPDRVPVRTDGRRLKATMVLLKSGRYRFQLKTTDGEVQEERRGHDIELELDEPPEVTLEVPKESPLEVNERDRLTLAFSARDDFALGEAAVAWRVLGSNREGKSRLTAAPTGLRDYSGSGELDLSQLDLKPGDRVAYSVEVRDNDTVNGPKVGSSETKELRIYSKQVHHQQVMALQQQALDELVHILGDNLEHKFEPKGEVNADLAAVLSSNKIVERAMLADELLLRTVLAVKKDPLGRPQVAEAFERARNELGRDARRKRAALAGAKSGLERSKRLDAFDGRSVRGAQEGMISDLEKNSVYLADLLNDQRMIDAQALAKQLRTEQQALKEALAAYQQAPTPEKRAELAKAIAEIRNRIQEIAKELAGLKSSIPQDFMNPDALDAQDDAAEMDRVQQLIEEGDLEAAMKALDKMLGRTEEMLAELGQGRDEMQSREYSEITEMAQEIWKDLDQLEKDQRDLARRTEMVSKELHERMKSRLGDAASFVEKQKKRLEQARATVAKGKPETFLPDADSFDRVDRRLDDAMKALDAQDFGAALEVLEQAAGEMAQLEQDAARRLDQARRFGDFFGSTESAERTERSMRRARPTVEDVLKEINDLMPPPQSLLSESEKEQMKRFAERQGELGDKAGKLRQDLEKLSEMLPIVGPEVKESLDGAKSDMKAAEGSLGSGDAPGGLGQERAALDKLGQLKDQLEKMGSGQGGGQGGGVPLPFGDRQGGGADQGQNGREHDPNERVQIPKPEEYQAPAEFREDLLEAAKQGTVESYKDAVRRYYEELVK